MTGTVSPAAAVGSGPLLITPTQRGFFSMPGADASGPVPPTPILLPQVVLEEVHIDDMVLTDHPIENGSSVTDHAFKRPKEVLLHWAWSNSPAIPQDGVSSDSDITGQSVMQVKEIYALLVRLQESRQLFTICTGKRVYNNMTFASLRERTNKHFEQALGIEARCREIIIAYTQTVSVSQINAATAKEPAKATPIDKGQTTVTSVPAPARWRGAGASGSW